MNLQTSGWCPCSGAQHGLFLTAAVTSEFPSLLLNKHTNQRGGKKRLTVSSKQAPQTIIRWKSTNLTRGVDVLGWWWLPWTVVSLAETSRSLSFRQLSSLWCSLLTSACSICMETLTKKKKHVEILLGKKNKTEMVQQISHHKIHTNSQKSMRMYRHFKKTAMQHHTHTPRGNNTS